MMFPPRPGFFVCLTALLLAPASLWGDDGLAGRIDALIDGELIGPVAIIADDAEFLRRVSLDLQGMIPTAGEARAFLDDPSPNKRQLLVDRLLASPRYAVHMANLFDVMLMERRPDKHVTTPEWQKYLQAAFEKNVPFNQLAHEILAADGVDPVQRPAAKFFLDRDAEPNIMARDIGRIFFGMDLQCAQCHDHPLVDHYLQTDYHGLYAFVNRTNIFTDEVAKKTFLAEKADGEATYKSVFTQDSGQIRPQLPDENELEEPRLRQGEDYAVPPYPGLKFVPKYSRRAKLAELATNGRNRQFNLNIANRLWGQMMGRGLVHPVDLHHPLNPPTHPAVLDLITNEFVAHKYDTRWLLRELALTRTYQRSIEAPAEFQATLVKSSASLPPLTAEFARLKSIAQESETLVDAAQKEFKSARAALAPVEAAWRAAEVTVTTAKKPLDDALIALAKAEKAVADKQAAIQAVTEATAKSTEAVKLLPADKEIAAALATFTAKQKQFTDELATVQKAVIDQQAALPPHQAKLTEAYGPADLAYSAYLEARKPVDAAKAHLIQVWNRHKADSFQSGLAKKRLEANESQVAFQSILTNLSGKQAELGQRRAELAVAIAAVEQQQQELAKQTAADAEVAKTMKSSTDLLDQANTLFVAGQSAVQAVTDACTKTEVALQKLPADVELTAIAQKLKERLDLLSKEVALQEQVVATRKLAVKDLSTKLAESKQRTVDMTAEMTSRQQGVASRTTTIDQLLAATREVESSIDPAREKLVELWTNGTGVRGLKQLSPEQIGWSLMQATGVIDPHRPAADAEIEKTVPKVSVAADPALTRSREVKVEQQLNEIMRGNVAQFIGLYAASAGQPQDDFFATPDQALFVANGGTVIGWAASGQLAQRLAPIMDAKAFAEELYLSTLTRRPSEIETNEVTQYLALRPAERPNAIRELVWSLVTSAEFRFNH